MEVKYERCGGLDVHARSVVGCVIVAGEDGRAEKEYRTFGTTTAELEALAGWVVGKGCTHVVMESTGVYWKPIFNILEGRVVVVVVNPDHLKRWRGRKTDVQDAEWLADLLRHDLVRGSFIPSAEQRAWRDLTRYRARLTDERTQEVNRVQKVLEDANIKLAQVASDIMGVSGRAILAQLLQGQTDPVQLAALAKGRLRDKQADLEQALRGQFKAHHRFMLIQHLSHIDYLDQAIDRLDQELDGLLRPFEPQLERWDQLPGINRRVAEILLAEIGVDLSQFEDAEHLASWAGVCPGHHESGGKRFSGRTRKGSRWLRRALIEAAHGAARTKNSYFKALYHRLAARRGKKRAIMAVAHALLVTGFYLITRQQDYQDLGLAYLDDRHKERAKRQAIRRLEKLGFQVQLIPNPVPTV
jgi:transposase